MINSAFILKELSKSGTLSLKAENAVIKCPFHDQHNPIGTCSVSLGSKIKCGVWHCWSCKASGSWNTLASKLGLRLDLNSEENDFTYVIHNTKCSVYNEPDKSSLELSSLPKDFKWKKYDRKFLKKMNAKLLWNSEVKDYYLYLPIMYAYDYYGYVRCKIMDDSFGPKYWFSIKTKIPYPCDYILENGDSTIVLVEGIADAFRLIKHGIPALSLFGLHLTPSMLNILESLAIEKVILCMDGDEAGKQAVFGKKGLASVLEKNNIESRVLFPPDNNDPDDMPMSYIYVLKSMIQRLED